MTEPRYELLGVGKNVLDGDSQALAYGNEILRTVVGSGVHGMAIEGHDDHDEMGVYIETKMQVLGLDKRNGHHTARTKPKGERSGPGDVDLSLYTLDHFMRLATAGNPTVLTVLYAPNDAIKKYTEAGALLRAYADNIVSWNSAFRHLGYLNGQFERMKGGGRQSRVPNRPELVEKYGYDTKYASHALRLGLQGLELIEWGWLMLPMAPEPLGRCMDIKTGRYTYQAAVAAIQDVQAELVDKIDRHKAGGFDGALRDKPNYPMLSRMMARMYERHWDETGQRP